MRHAPHRPDRLPHRARRRRLPTTTLVVVLGVLVAAALTVAPPPAQADFYKCRFGGRTWVVNQIPKGMKKHCRLAMKTKKKRADDGGDDGAASAGGKKKRHYAVRPHKPRKASTAEIPGDRLFRLVLEAAERYDLPPAFVLAVIKVESNFNPRAVSRVGAMGLMQLMPGTADDLGVTDAFDPRQNVMGGCKYLRMLANRFDGDLPRTIAGYHAGGGAVAKKQGVPYAATEQYVRWVLDRYYEYKEKLSGLSL